MITGEDAESAGVDGQHLGDAELHREVRDALWRNGFTGLCIPPEPLRRGEVILQLGRQIAHPGDELLVGGECVHPVLIDVGEDTQRVAGARPALRIDRREQFLGGDMPHPPEIVRENCQIGEPRGEWDPNVEPAECFHGVDATQVGPRLRGVDDEHRVDH